MTKRVKLGFTLVEVALFLAVTGVLFIGIAAGVQGSMFQQRFNDSVQSFAEYLRSMYSQTMNVENNNTDESGNLVVSGNSEYAIYGKLVVFGEEKNLEGNVNTDKAIFSYTVIGKADGDLDSGNIKKSLKQLDVNVFIKTRNEDGVQGFKLAGIAEEYFPRWGAEIQTTNGLGVNNRYSDFNGSLLIVRHPKSGTVFTLFSENIIDINNMFSNPSIPNPLEDLSSFTIKDVDFCVNPEGDAEGEKNRRDIRIVAGARNASGVEVIGQEDNTVGTGNRCEK